MVHTDLCVVPGAFPVPLWLARQLACQAVLDCLTVTEGADALFLARQTGLHPAQVAAHLRELATAGYVGAAGRFSSLVGLTDHGRAAHDAARRWRFRAGAAVLCACLSASRRGRDNRPRLPRRDTDD